MMVAPGIITAPVMGVARVLGFTTRGIAASKSTFYSFVQFFLPSHFTHTDNNPQITESVASGVQSAAGNVAAKSAFATVQSAATGGYGTGVLVGIVRVAGGAVAGAAGMGRGLFNWLGGGHQEPPPCCKED